MTGLFRLKPLSILLLFIALLDLGATGAYWKFFAVQNRRVPKARAGFVFFSSPGPYHGMNRRTVLRLQFAASLLKRKKLEQVVGIGGHWKANGYNKTGMKEILLKAGVPASQVQHDLTSYDTLTNLKEAFRIAQEMGWKEISFISSPLHLSRMERLVASEPRPENVKIKYIPITPESDDTLQEIWRETHHEWAALLALYVMPRDLYKPLIRSIRL